MRSSRGRMTRSLSWFSAIHGSPLARLVVFGQAVRSFGSFQGPGDFSMSGGAGIGFGQGPAMAGQARQRASKVSRKAGAPAGSTGHDTKGLRDRFQSWRASRRKPDVSAPRGALTRRAYASTLAK